MISLPLRRPRQSSNIDALYGMIVAQARSEAFYRGYGVPDTVAGRLDMILLHLVLLMRSLAKGHDVAPPASQQLFDRFCQDIDDNFREMGVGDLAVPKEMQRVVGAFYGRAKAYEAALAEEGEAGLVEALSRNVFGVAAPPLGARRLAAYMRQATLRLATPEAGAPAPLKSAFPEPDSIAPP